MVKCGGDEGRALLKLGKGFCTSEAVTFDRWGRNH